MGLPFAEFLQTYCGSVKDIPIAKIAKVERNPDRSKHLETAKATVLGIELDFVNLRSEEYAEDSRIPTQIAFGTPLQDALRRDITINALFYNVHSRSVEDLTEKGLQDLKDGIIRTPLSPKETFMDDPLRIVRCIRFSSRFGFTMVPELQAAAKDGEIQHALRTKISRERIGEELDKMMKGRDPLLAIKLISELGLYSSIFYIPPAVAKSFSAPVGPASSALAAACVLHTLTHRDVSRRPTLPPLHPVLSAAAFHEPSTLPRLYLACALTPYRSITYEDAKQKPRSGVEGAIREGTKLGVQNHYLDGVTALFEAADILKNPTTGGDNERARMGKINPLKSVHASNKGAFWATSMLFSLVQELVPFWHVDREDIDVEEATKRIEAYNAFITRAEALDLLATAHAKALLDGNDIVRVLETSQRGPWTGEVLERVVEWQLANPERTKEQCEQWLREERTAGRIVIAQPTQAKKSRN
ncbi:hypothetical protein PHLGIDRAFT_77897 [Phlebiopsis gigantea 11061_1 CR5-6]|uniref:Poly A polymerase head domain-containing protein n=1 Tax=Phlebiopsis gigantea (strain 11061_1 CR5-6) TaxID=745531 RepID=A0A0C3RSC9_PHLG1|nr:hypothetical protein PHLGIDRAFT_77897 [Phlebiopsis gigantea 11061_1 CR5-6]